MKEGDIVCWQFHLKGRTWFKHWDYYSQLWIPVSDMITVYWRIKKINQ